MAERLWELGLKVRVEMVRFLHIQVGVAVVYRTDGHIAPFGDVIFKAMK